MRFFGREGVHAFTHAAQVEEKFALRLGGGHAHHAPVAQDKFVDFSLNPMYGKGKQAGTAIGFITFYGFHQADVAFLNQVGLVEAVAIVAACDGYHYAQMRQNQFLGGFQVALQLAYSQAVFFFYREQRDAVYRVNVLLQAAVAAGDGQCKCVIHCSLIPFGILHRLRRHLSLLSL